MTDVTPPGYTTITHWITTPDTGKLLEFITEVFDGEELGRVPFKNGMIGHAEIRVGNTIVLAFDRAEDWPEMPSLLRVWVLDVDATMLRAVEAGAAALRERDARRAGELRPGDGRLFERGEPAAAPGR